VLAPASCNADRWLLLLTISGDLYSSTSFAVIAVVAPRCGCRDRRAPPAGDQHVVRRYLSCTSARRHVGLLVSAGELADASASIPVRPVSPRCRDVGKQRSAELVQPVRLLVHIHICAIVLVVAAAVLGRLRIFTRPTSRPSVRFVVVFVGAGALRAGFLPKHDQVLVTLFHLLAAEHTPPVPVVHARAEPLHFCGCVKVKRTNVSILLRSR